MAGEFEILGEVRVETGSSASRRLRKAGKVPAIMFGGEGDPLAFSVNQNEVRKHLENEAFSSHILTVKIGDNASQAVLKAVTRDPVSSEVVHMDLLRINADKEISMNVPLHFLHEETCPGVKKGGIVTHLVLETEVRCLPKNLPEYLEVDVSAVDIGETVHLSDMNLPLGVELVSLRHGGASDDAALVSVQLAREDSEDEVTDGDDAGLEGDVAKLVESGSDEES